MPYTRIHKHMLENIYSQVPQITSFNIILYSTNLNNNKDLLKQNLGHLEGVNIRGTIKNNLDSVNNSKYCRLWALCTVRNVFADLAVFD